MESPEPSLARRIRSLERRLRMTQLILLAAFSCLVGLAAGGTGGQEAEVADSIRARKIDVVDDQGVVRISMGQDASDAQRRSRACGITVYDRKGDERGGMGTMDDLSAVIALDAPVGVGGAMRDRVGMMVSPDGSSQVVLIDNQMQASVRLVTDPKGAGSVELYGYENGKGTVRRVSCAGDEASQLPSDEGK